MTSATKKDPSGSFFVMVAEARFELATSGLWARRATRLLYSAILPFGSHIIRQPDK